MHYRDSDASGFEGVYLRKSLISTLSKNVFFDKDMGYKIQNTSEGWFVQPTNVLIEVKFVES